MNELEFLELKKKNYIKTGKVFNSSGKIVPKKPDKDIMQLIEGINLLSTVR